MKADLFLNRVLLEQMDRFRSFVLRKTMSITLFRTVFCDRDLRLSFLFVFSGALSLVCSVLFPLWVLVLGPIVYGVPHLFASLRYTYLAVTKRKKVALKTVYPPSGLQRGLGIFHFLFIVLAIIRVFCDLGIMPSSSIGDHGYLLELVGLVVAGILFTMTFYFRGSELFLSGVICGLFCIVFIKYPTPVLGVLLLLHNFIAFFYWLSYTSSQREKMIAFGACVSFALVHVGIFRGIFDFVYPFYTPSAALPWAGLDYSEIGKTIVPWSSHYELWFHSVVAYAFGQSMHYFIWLKIIPDLNHYHSIPTSFRQSYKLLVQDFGRRLANLAGVISVGFLGVWILINLPMARNVYFAVAAFHGYFEMVALFFLVAGKISSLFFQEELDRKPTTLMLKPQ